MDLLHKISHDLARRNTLIKFEDLNISGLVRNHRLAKRILDAGWDTLIRLTTYKSVALGGRTDLVNPAYTTVRCSRCGMKVPKTLAERVHCCPYCRLVMDRDQNAAINISVGQGLPKPNARGERASTRKCYSAQAPSVKREASCVSEG